MSVSVEVFVPCSTSRNARLTYVAEGTTCTDINKEAGRRLPTLILTGPEFSSFLVLHCVLKAFG